MKIDTTKPNNTSHRPVGRWVSKIASIVSYIVMGVVVFAALALVILKVTGGGAYIITSGSMEPAYQIGSVVVAVPVEFERLHEGDAISFRHADGIATHRIIEIDSSARCVYTKGDANNTPDGDPIAYADIVGVVKLHVPAVGKAVLWVQGLFGGCSHGEISK